MEENEFLSVLSYLYEKTLILQDPGQFNKVLYFYLVDSLAHIDYTAGIYAFNILSPKNIMGGEYLRWRIDEEKKGDRRNPLPLDFFYVIIDEFFETEFLKSLYEDASLSTLFKTYSAAC